MRLLKNVSINTNSNTLMVTSCTINNYPICLILYLAPWGWDSSTSRTLEGGLQEKGLINFLKTFNSQLTICCLKIESNIHIV